jgi:hypothetical protein
VDVCQQLLLCSVLLCGTEQSSRLCKWMLMHLAPPSAHAGWCVVHDKDHVWDAARVSQQRARQPCGFCQRMHATNLVPQSCRHVWPPTDTKEGSGLHVHNLSRK